MTNLELLYDHYKDTFNLIKGAEKERNNLFIVLSLLITTLYMNIVEPKNIFKTLNDISKGLIGANIYFSFNVIQSLIWIIAFYYSIRYFQLTSYIERQYTYLHKVENIISDEIKIDFSREGKSYLDGYPLLFHMIYIIYTWFFPILYIFIIIAKVVIEWRSNNASMFFNVFNSIIGILIIAITFFYLLLLHPIKKK